MKSDQPKKNNNHRTDRAAELLTGLIGLLVLIAAGAGVFVPGFYDGAVDPQYAIGTITADAISILCVPLLVVSIILTRREKPVARLVWVALLVYVGYAYAVYAFDRMYTIFFPVYMAIFSMSVFAVAALIARLDVTTLAEISKDMRLRKMTAGFVIFTGLILYVIELPIILGRIPNTIEAGGTPFMVLDMTLVAPLAVLTGIWVWQRRPWGDVLAGIFLVKAITIMTSFLIADYINWFNGVADNQSAIITFTIVYVLVYVFSWNYFSAFTKQKQYKLQAI